MKTESLIAQVYSAFNQRNIDGALAFMSDSVSWPKASEGGRVVGKEEIRAYWRRQWEEFDPHVDPLEVLDQGAGRTHVRVRQLVKSLGGDVLSDSEVWHVYTNRKRSDRTHGSRRKRSEFAAIAILGVFPALGAGQTSALTRANVS